MKAVILCGGLGTRLGSLTKDTPKPLLEVAGKPFIAHVLNREDYGHTPAFHKMFDKLLCLAAKKGVYDPNAPHPDVYAGVSLKGITFPTSCARHIDLDENFTVVAEPSGEREY